MSLIRNVYLLEKLKKLVEQDMCQEQKLVESFEPHQLRIVSLLGEEFRGSLGYYDESSVPNEYPELCQQVSQHEARYMWAILKNFNEYYAPVIPFVSQQDQSASSCANDSSILPMGIAAYISLTRDLCFNSVKSDLRQLILDKTTQPREQPPKLYFERLRLAEGHEDKGDKQADK